NREDPHDTPCYPPPVPCRNRHSRSHRGLSGPRAGQAETALLGRVLRAGHPRGNDENVRRRDRRRFCLRRLLRRQPVQAGHRARRDSARQPRDGQHRTAGHFQADPRLVDRDGRIPLPRRRHVKTFFNSDPGKELKKMAEDQLGVVILGPTYFGVRQVGLKPEKEIKTPADMAGIKLRMPGGDAWQFLGEALGANPTPMAYAEVYTGLQTGAIDGQDNPLPNVENMKFYEVMSQIVLTSHLVGFDLLTVSKKVWDEMGAEKQAKFQAAAD